IVTRLRYPNLMLYAGYACMIISFSGIAMIERTTAHWVIAALMAIGGAGMGCIVPNLNVFAQETAERTQLGIATALLQSLRMMGALLGTAVVGVLVNQRYVAGVSDALAAADAGRWQALLSDPQILVSKEAQAPVVEAPAQAGHNG